MRKIACLIRPHDASYRANCAILVENPEQVKQLQVAVVGLEITNDNVFERAEVIVAQLGFGEVIEFDRLPKISFKFTIPRPT